MDFKEVDCDAGDCIDIAEDREQCKAYVTAVMNPWVP